MISRVRVLDSWVNAVTAEELVDVVEDEVRRRSGAFVANHNLHSLYLVERYPDVRAIIDGADYVHADGMSVVLLARLLGGRAIRRAHRITYVDWLPMLLRRAEARGWRVFFLGGRPEVLRVALERLRVSYPALEIEGRDGYFFSQEGPAEAEIVARINAFRPDLLIVGLGMPLQERWIAEHRDRIDTGVVLASGAATDYIAGVLPTPPRWAGRIGLEWLFRLGAEPRRLAARYLVEPLLLVGARSVKRLRQLHSRGERCSKGSVLGG